MTLQSQTILKYLTQSEVPPAMIEGLRASIARVDGVSADFRREISHLNKNGDFTDTGRKKRVMEAAEQAAARLRAIASDAAGYDGHITQLRAQIKPADRQGDPILLYMQEQEVRARLADLDQLELQIKYQEACREGGPGADVIADAIEGDPMPRLDQAVLQEGFAVRAARTSPEQTTKMRHIMQVRDALQSAIREAMQELIDAGLPTDDPIAAIGGATSTAD